MDEPQKKTSWSFWLALGVTVVPVVASFAVTTYAVSEFKSDLKSTEERLIDQIKQVDLNSANRRVDGHEEMLRLHDTQAQQILQVREDLRDHIREAKGQ